MPSEPNQQDFLTRIPDHQKKLINGHWCLSMQGLETFMGLVEALDPSKAPRMAELRQALAAGKPLPFINPKRN